MSERRARGSICALWAPLALLALAAPAPAIAPLALLAGAQLTLLNTFWETTLQEQVSPTLLSRVTAIDWLSSVATQPIGYALVGVLASSVLGIGTTLWLAAGTALVASAAIAAFPSIRHVEAEPRDGHASSSLQGSSTPTGMSLNKRAAGVGRASDSHPPP